MNETPRFVSNDEKGTILWIPAYAGMTEGNGNDNPLCHSRESGNPKRKWG
jgi:hypothetical protein